MGMPLPWHRRHALLLASQLPEDTNDAKMVMAALAELMDTFLAQPVATTAELANNVLPFVAG